MWCAACAAANTPSQCTFWCLVLSDITALNIAIQALTESQCTFWCLVLSDTRLHKIGERVMLYQCTFWCLVLSDSTPRKQRHNAAYWSEIAADLESTAFDRLTPLQLNHTTAENRHKQPQHHRHPLPTSTPPASNKPKPKNHHLKVTYQKLF